MMFLVSARQIGTDKSYGMFGVDYLHNKIGLKLEKTLILKYQLIKCD